MIHTGIAVLDDVLLGAVILAVLAGGVTGFRTLWKTGRKITLAADRLYQIGSIEQWPNGSKDLPSSLKAIYKRATHTDEKVTRIAEHFGIPLHDLSRDEDDGVEGVAV